MAAVRTVPVNKFALIFIDARQILITNADLTQKIMELFGSRSVPIIYDGSSGCWEVLQEWLLQPISRKNDMIIIGANHACNGIETNIVVHVYPENCPECGVCFEDPVVISRSTAFLAMSKYKCTLPCFHCQQHEHQIQRNVSIPINSVQFSASIFKTLHCLQRCRWVFKSGWVSSNVVGIICPPGCNRVN